MLAVVASFSDTVVVSGHEFAVATIGVSKTVSVIVFLTVDASSPSPAASRSRRGFTPSPARPSSSSLQSSS
ncbi:unnamed protein product [Phytophthora fragariaefolia]|uniref:Unnamed protein product n=1 Tax=Phytophthora fragariaefolia TaxID=1490495 RepID=A0A9W6XRZ5_9STRA|nr:unnamed protein product [Phytophthora fragariaefolia]